MYTDSINYRHKIQVEKLKPKLQGKQPEVQQGNFDSKNCCEALELATYFKS